MSPNLRRRLLWLIGGRAAVVTLLLGSAILIQIQAPGSLPIDPFFFLIGLTYALTVVYMLLLQARGAAPLAGGRAARRATRSSSRRSST